MGDVIARSKGGLRRLPLILIAAVLVSALVFSSLAILATQQAARDALASAEDAAMQTKAAVTENTRLTEEIDGVLEKVANNGKLLRKTQRRIIKILKGVRIDCKGMGEVLECSLIVPQIEVVRVITDEGEVKIIRRIVCRLPNGRRCPRPPKTTP
jgi:cell division protein FtsL